MQQLIDVQTVIKSLALISTMGAIAIPHAWLKCIGEEWNEKGWWRGGGGEAGRVMDMGGIIDEWT